MNDNNNYYNNFPEENTVVEPSIETTCSPEVSTVSSNGGFNPKPPKRKWYVRFAAYMVILTFVSGFTFGAGYLTASYYGTSLPGMSNQPTASTTSTTELSKDEGISITQVQGVVTNNASGSTIATIAQEVSPAIVTIGSYSSQMSYGYLESYDDYYSGTGSGIIFQVNEDELLIVTNYHVIEGATKLEVIFSNSATIEAETLGYNSLNDIAVLSVPLDEVNENVDNIVIATFADSDDVVVGELAVAIGNPLGAEYALTVTAGIISATGRDIAIDENTTQVNLLQTDAAINPGNSGGALLNNEGQVIGINSAKYVDESVEGIGFAIPSNDAQVSIDEILESRSGSDVAYELADDRAFLGVGIMDINATINAETGMTFGVYITEVYPGSGADESGIQAGDIIYGINGDRIQNVQELFILLDSASVGDTLVIELVRDNQLLQVEAPLYSYKEVMEQQN